MERAPEKRARTAWKFRRRREIVSSVTQPPPIVPRFEVAELIGSGGMGLVYRARDRATSDPVALKILPRGDDRARFEREASVLARLSHPGIVGFVDHGVADDGRPYLAMRWLEGETLAQRLRRRNLTLPETRLLGLRITEALQHAHSVGVVHRDLKPSNLFLVGRDPNRVVLIDFGIAALASAATRLTTTGTVLGTAAYMAPEQARGGAAVDARCDLFSLGSVLFRCVTGRPPFDGGDLRVILAKLMFDEPPPLPSHVPDTLASLIRKLLSKEAEARPPSAKAVHELLERVTVALPLEEVTHETVARSDRGASLSASEQQLASVVLIELTHDASVTPGESNERLTRLPERAEVAGLRALVATFGASLEPLMGGSLVAVLRGSGDATDLAARAARCALAVQGEVPPDSVLSVATGRAVVHGEVPVGEVVERATVLAALSGEPPGVRLDHVSAGLLDTSFALEPGPRCTRLLDYRPDPGTLRSVLGRQAPCLGRAREISALLGSFEECSQERAPRVALVTGVPGSGKSRIRHELTRVLAAHPARPLIWACGGDPIAGESAFRSLLGLVRVAQRAGSSRELSARFASALDVGQAHAAWQDPQARTQRVHEAWEAWLRHECQARPLVLLLDDLSWFDAASLACIDDALLNLEGCSLSVMGFARPDVRERFPGLWQRRGLLELGLAPLTTRTQLELARTLLGDHESEETVSRIVALAGGNAFYLEELVRAVASGRGDALPDTVMAMSQARFAALPAADRRLLRAASIFGGPFWTEGLGELTGLGASPRDLERELERLCRDEVLQREHDSRHPGSSEWSFRQTLLREAAYHALTEEDRLLGHRLAAEWLTRVRERDPVVLAHHWSHAGLHERARAAFVSAAWAAFAAGDPRTVRRFAESALTEGIEGAPLGEVCFLLGAAARFKGDMERSLELMERSLDLLPADSDLWRAAALRVAAAAAALGHRTRFLELAELLVAQPVSPDDPPSIAIAALLGAICLQSGDVTLATRCFEHLDSVNIEALATRDAATAARILEARARRDGARGDLEAQLDNAERAVHEFERSGQASRASSMRIVAANAAMALGDWSRARSHLEQAIVPARRHALENVEALCRANLGLVLARTGDAETGSAQLGTAIDLFARQGDRRGEGGARAYRAQLFLARSNAAEARAESERADTLLQVAPPLRPLALAARARALLSLGKLDAACESAEEAWAIAEAHRGAESEGWALAALCLAETQQAQGDHGQARAFAQGIAERLRARAARISDPRQRHGFLHGIPEHAALLALASAD